MHVCVCVCQQAKLVFQYLGKEESAEKRTALQSHRDGGSFIPVEGMY